MAKEMLAECWIYDGIRYGPGEADLPDDAHKALKERGAFAAKGKKAAPKPAEGDGDGEPPKE